MRKSAELEYIRLTADRIGDLSSDIVDPMLLIANLADLIARLCRELEKDTTP